MRDAAAAPGGRRGAARAWWRDPSLVARATRAKTLPLVLAPVAVGGAFAAGTGSFSGGRFALALAGAAGLHLGANVVNDYYDERSGADGIARLDKGSIATGAGLIAAKKVTPAEMRLLAGVAWSLAAVAGVALAVDGRPGVVPFGAAGALLAHQYVARPLRYGYVGRGLGELGVFIAYGPLAVAGGAYATGAPLSDQVVWVSLVPGALAALVVAHHNFLHHRADATAKKMTPVAVWGPERAIVGTGVGLIVAYAALPLLIAADVMGGIALLGLLTAVPVAAAWARAARDQIAQNCLTLLGATLGAAVLTDVAIALSLL